MKDDPEDEPISDEVRPEDGRLRYWMFANGEQARLFAGMTAGGCLLVLCYLYVLGVHSEAIKTTVVVIGIVGYVSWRLLDRELRRYEERCWQKKGRSPRVERAEMYVAAALWLFIILVVGGILLWKWHGHH